MGDQLFSYKGNVSASAVLSAHPAKLHAIVLNSVASTATIQLFDDTTTTSPANPITGVWTPGAVVVPDTILLDIATTKGLVVIIGVAAANVTAVGNFSS